MTKHAVHGIQLTRSLVFIFKSLWYLCVLIMGIKNIYLGVRVNKKACENARDNIYTHLLPMMTTTTMTTSTMMMMLLMLLQLQKVIQVFDAKQRNTRKCCSFWLNPLYTSVLFSRCRCFVVWKFWNASLMHCKSVESTWERKRAAPFVKSHLESDMKQMNDKTTYTLFGWFGCCLSACLLLCIITTINSTTINSIAWTYNNLCVRARVRVCSKDNTKTIYTLKALTHSPFCIA